MTSHTILGGVFQSLRDVGAFQYVLFPLLTFAIVYGVLRKIQLFEDRNEIDAIIALVIAAFAAIYVPVGGSMVIFLSNMFGAWAVVLVVIVLALTGAGLLGWSPSDGDRGALEKGIMGVALLALVLIFLSWGGVSFVSPTTQIPIFLTSQDMLALLVVSLGVLAVYYVGFRGDDDNGGGGGGGDEDE